MRLLLVEDDRELAAGLGEALARSNHATDIVHDGEAARAACDGTEYQLIIMDLSLPDGDGVDVIRWLRQRRVTTPVLILTARDDLDERIRGLDAGGDDYLTKPFALGELEARIRALLRRSEPSVPLLAFDGLEFDPGTKIVTVDGQPVDVTAREMTVLELLLRRPGRVVSKHQMLEALYNWDQHANPTIVEVFISRLRRKLAEAGASVSIRALRGLGYRLEAER
ncbi:MAG TPA: response regulator transcription factor [Sphingobium sp.]|uniref:response regulator transcription factor n=1 Tax=Sphingobium sp. TaxID=1912891 RepID=UPI002ED43030